MKICINCIYDDYLKKIVSELKSVSKCTLCKEEDFTIELSEIAEMVDDIFREHYIQGKLEPIFCGDSNSPDWDRSGTDPINVVCEITELDYEISKMIFEYLDENLNSEDTRDGEEPFYDDTMLYEENEISDFEHQNEWQHYKYIIKHSNRFFSSKLSNILEVLFSNIDSYETNSEKQVIRVIEPTEEIYIYRARKANGEEIINKIKENPILELGPPPKHITPDGRMNPKGIPVFYCSLNEETCLDEIRLSVGEAAGIGKFKIIMPLKILDLTALKKVYLKLSYFDSDFNSKISKIKFLRDFEKAVSKPILSHEENLEYLPTQVLAEYIFYQTNLDIDAIQYSSSQTEGDNLVIKKESSKIQISEKEGETSKKDTYSTFDFLKHEDSFFDYDELHYEPKLSLLKTEITFKKCISKSSSFDDMTEYDDMIEPDDYSF